MNVTRIAILGVAALAAGMAALLVRGMLGGGTPPVQASLPPPPAATVDVLVASKDIPPGRVLDVGSVRWDTWPKNSVSSIFITKQTQPDINKAVAGVVVRSPLTSGQPITEASIVRAGATGFLAATITPGMRAIAITVSAETGAGGFVLPNDRVDVVLTRDVSGGSGVKDFQSETLLRNVRVLAIDQTAQQQKDQQSQVGKTATLELFPDQAEYIAQSQASGTLSLSLRSLGDSGNGKDESGSGRARTGSVAVIRYGVLKSASTSTGGKPQ